MLRSYQVEEYLYQFKSNEGASSYTRGSYWNVPIDIRRMVDYWLSRPNGFNVLLGKVKKLEQEYPNLSCYEYDDFEPGE